MPSKHAQEIVSVTRFRKTRIPRQKRLSRFDLSLSVKSYHFAQNNTNPRASTERNTLFADRCVDLQAFRNKPPCSLQSSPGGRGKICVCVCVCFLRVSLSPAWSKGKLTEQPPCSGFKFLFRHIPTSLLWRSKRSVFRLRLPPHQ